MISGETVRMIGHGFWVANATTGNTIVGPYLKRQQAECELLWREHDREQDHAMTDTHDRWQMAESRMWDG